MQSDEIKNVQPLLQQHTVSGSTGKLSVFVVRMKKLNINIDLIGNYPWIYIDKINGKKVTERFEGNHGFTVAFLPVRVDQELRFTDIGEIFRLLRKYCR